MTSSKLQILLPACLWDHITVLYSSFLGYLHSLDLAATIFAYGQTSSGKTYTMRGITESVIKDIYRFIHNVSYN